MTEEPKRPNGISIDVTATNQVVLHFDHGEIPPIALTQQGAERVGSHISTAADKARDAEPEHEGQHR
jgi:hypothetical protein